MDSAVEPDRRWSADQAGEASGSSSTSTWTRPGLEELDDLPDHRVVLQASSRRRATGAGLASAGSARLGRAFEPERDRPLEPAAARPARSSPGPRACRIASATQLYPVGSSTTRRFGPEIAGGDSRASAPSRAARAPSTHRSQPSAIASIAGDRRRSRRRRRRGRRGPAASGRPGRRRRALGAGSAQRRLGFFFSTGGAAGAGRRTRAPRAGRSARRARSRFSSRATRTRASSTSSRPCGLPRSLPRASARICSAARIVSSGQRSTTSWSRGLCRGVAASSDDVGAGGQDHRRRGGTRAARSAGRPAGRPDAAAWSTMPEGRGRRRGRRGRRAGRAVRSSLAVPSCWWTSSTVSVSPPTERSCSRSDWASRIDPPARRAIDPQRLGLGLDPLPRADLGQGLDDLLGRDPGEVVPLAAREDGDRDLVRLGRGEEELDVLAAAPPASSAGR